MLDAADSLLPVYAQLPVRPVRGQGSWLYDESGARWLVTKICTNLHRGFHELFPPLEEPIKRFEARKAKGWA
jgi:hypothetical protein